MEMPMLMIGWLHFKGAKQRMENATNIYIIWSICKITVIVPIVREYIREYMRFHIN